MRVQARRPPGAALHSLLLRLPPELAHGLGMRMLRLSGRSAAFLAFLRRRARVTAEERLRQRLLGLDFPNPLGLAAGFDKNGVAIPALAALGFGGLEVGTVTPRAQKGNPRPRLFRYTDAAALENSMGFNNAGKERLRRRLQRDYPAPVPIGVNIGKNKLTANDRAVDDYVQLFEAFDDLCDYFVINISSPNTPGLRDLQSSATVRRLLVAGKKKSERPIFVKLSPDLDTSQAIGLATSAVEAGASGIILANTTTNYSLLPAARGMGGLSGLLLRERSYELLVAVAKELFGRCLLVSVGGVDTGAELYRRLRAGAQLVQVYTGFAFGGPAFPGRVLRELVECLDGDGVPTVDEAVGADL